LRSRDGARWVVAAALAATVLGLATVGGASPARADERDHWRHEREERHDRDWYRRHHYPPAYVAPAPVYTPPPVIYAPPPPPPAINFVFPLRFR
jgi:hypothetical protein